MKISTPITVLAVALSLWAGSSNDSFGQPRPPGPPMGGGGPRPVMGPMGGGGPPRGMSFPGGIGGSGGPPVRMGAPPGFPNGGFGGPAQRLGIGPNAGGPGRALGPISSAARPQAFGPGGVGGQRALGPGGLSSLAKSSALARNPSTYALNRQALSEQASQVRNEYSGHDYSRGNWWGQHAGAWQAARWAAAAEAYSGYGNCSVYYGYCGYSSEPYYYDYGSTVIYEGDNVYINGETVATQGQYAQQATIIAELGKRAGTAEDEEWLSLGVFAMVQGGQADANVLFQLAVNKSGVLRGNYYNALGDTTMPVYGSVDQRTQRAAWTIGDRKEPVFEAGFANLSRPETTMLVHFSDDRTQQWTLVRIEQSAAPQ